MMIMILQLKDRKWQDLDQVLRRDLSGEGTSEQKHEWNEGIMKPWGYVGRGWGRGKQVPRPRFVQGALGTGVTGHSEWSGRKEARELSEGQVILPILERPFKILHLIFLSMITSQPVIESFCGSRLLSKSCNFDLEPFCSNPLQYFCLKNPGTEEPGGPQSKGSQRVGQDRVAKHTSTRSSYRSVSLCFGTAGFWSLTNTIHLLTIINDAVWYTGKLLR